jgi:hypothetical protein
LSAWGNIPYCNSADIAEATACLQGVKAIIPFAVNPLIIESDNSMVIKELKSESCGKSSISLIMGEVKNLMVFFEDYKACKINRSANCVAHDIAGFARREWRVGVLQSAVPPCAVESTRDDCNGVCNRYILS